MVSLVPSLPDTVVLGEGEGRREKEGEGGVRDGGKMKYQEHNYSLIPLHFREGKLNLNIVQSVKFSFVKLNNL